MEIDDFTYRKAKTPVFAENTQVFERFCRQAKDLLRKVYINKTKGLKKRKNFNSPFLLQKNDNPCGKVSRIPD